MVKLDQSIALKPTQYRKVVPWLRDGRAVWQSTAEKGMCESGKDDLARYAYNEALFRGQFTTGSKTIRSKS